MRGHKRDLRLWIQIAFAALSNGYIAGFLRGKIYTGPLKRICLPGLNCYSCPGALGACPMGALQSALAGRNGGFPFYVVGFLLAVGALGGRFVCGFLCPFGLVQDLLHRIPLARRPAPIPGSRYLQYARYGVLLILVILLPMTVANAAGMGTPWFCKWLCPSGTLLGGLPLVSSNPSLQAAVGPLFGWKVGLLAVILAASVLWYRPFCRYLCPLGAVYGLLNPVSLFHYTVDAEKCTHCGACRRACKLGIDPAVTPNSPECIRCGVCVAACPTRALTRDWGGKRGKRPASCGGNCAGCAGGCEKPSRAAASGGKTSQNRK